MKNFILIALIAIISGSLLGTPVAHAAGACEVGANEVNVLIKKILDEPDTAPKVLTKADPVPGSAELQQKILASNPGEIDDADKFVSVITSDGGAREAVRITGHQDGQIIGDVRTIGPDGKDLFVSRALTPDELNTMRKSATSRQGFEGVPETPNSNVQKVAAVAKKALASTSHPAEPDELPEDIQRNKVEAAAKKAAETAATEARNQELLRLENNQLQYEKAASDYQKESGQAVLRFQQDLAFDDRAYVTVTRVNESGKLEPVQGRLIGDPSQTSDVLKIQTSNGVEEIPYNRIQRVANSQGHSKEFPDPVGPQPPASELPKPWMKADGTPGVYRSYSKFNPNQKILELLKKPPPHTIIKISSPEIRNLSGSEFEIIGRKQFSATVKSGGQQVYRDPATIPNDLIEVRFLNGPRAGQTTTFDPRDLNYLEIVH